MTAPDAVVLIHALEHARLVLRNSNAEAAHTLELLKKILNNEELEEAMLRFRRGSAGAEDHEQAGPAGRT